MNTTLTLQEVIDAAELLPVDMAVELVAAEWLAAGFTFIFNTNNKESFFISYNADLELAFSHAYGIVVVGGVSDWEEVGVDPTCPKVRELLTIIGQKNK